MSSAPISLDDLLAQSLQGGGIVATTAPAAPLVTVATPVVASPPVVVQPPGVPAAPGAPAEPPKQKRTRKPKAPPAPAAPVGQPDPNLTYQAGHVSSVGTANAGAPAMTVSSPGQAPVPLAQVPASPPVVFPTVLPQVPMAPIVVPPAPTSQSGVTASAFQPPLDLAAAANGFPSVAQPVATTQLPPPTVAGFEDEEGSVDDPDFFEGDGVVSAPPTVPAPMAQVGAILGPPMPPVTGPVQPQVAVQAPVAPAAPLQESNPADEMQALQLQQQAIQRAIFDLDQATGLQALKNPQQYNRGSAAEEAMHLMRFEPHQLSVLPPQRLVQLESALAANQAYMQSQENEARLAYEHLGRELDRIMFIRRESHKGDTKGAQENTLLANDPAVRQIRNQYLVAQAKKTYLEKMGDAYNTIVNGIKRATTLRMAELERSGGGRHTP